MSAYAVGDKVTIRNEAAYKFGGAVGIHARRGDVGTIIGICQHPSLGLLHTVRFPPLHKNESPILTELHADEMNRAEAGAD